MIAAMARRFLLAMKAMAIKLIEPNICELSQPRLLAFEVFLCFLNFPQEIPLLFCKQIPNAHERLVPNGHLSLINRHIFNEKQTHEMDLAPNLLTEFRVSKFSDVFSGTFQLWRTSKMIETIEKLMDKPTLRYRGDCQDF
jgi:hypothetical protein